MSYLLVLLSLVLSITLSQDIVSAYGNYFQVTEELLKCYKELGIKKVIFK